MPVIEQYDEAAVRKVVVDALSLAADTVQQAVANVIALKIEDATPDYISGLTTAVDAVRNIATAYATSDKSVDDITENARAKLTVFQAMKPEEIAKEMGDKLIELVKRAAAKAGMDPADIEIISVSGAVDKSVPDGENPQSVIERVFQPQLSKPPYPITALSFGRVKQGNAFGLYQNETGDKFPVLVACAGDAHVTNATAVFADRSAAENYIASDFDPDFLPLGDVQRPVAKRILN